MQLCNYSPRSSSFEDNVVQNNVVKVIVLVFSNISQERRKDAIVAILLKAFFDTRRPFLRELTVSILNGLGDDQ